MSTSTRPTDLSTAVPREPLGSHRRAVRRLVLLPLAALALAAACSDREPTGVRRLPVAAPRLDVGSTTTYFAYVVNRGSGTVSVIRTADDQVVATVGVGTGPWTVAVTPDGSHAYVTNSTDGTVSVIRTSDNTVETTVDVGTTPIGVAVTPDGAHVYVANRDDNTLSVIRTSDNMIEATLSTANQPFAIAFSPDGSRAYLATTGEVLSVDQVSEIQPGTGTVLRTASVGVDPEWLALTSDGARLYVGNANDRTVSVIETSGFTATSVTVAGCLCVRGIAIAPGDDRAYVASLDGDVVQVLRTSDNTITGTIAVGDNPIGVAGVPDGSRVYVANSTSGTVSVIDPGTNAVVGTIAVGSSPVGIAITPVAVPVSTPSQEITNLKLHVAGLDANRGIIASLQAKLDSALAALDAGDTATACSALLDFVNQVAAKSGKQIDPAIATALRGQANDIRQQLGC